MPPVNNSNQPTEQPVAPPSIAPPPPNLSDPHLPPAESLEKQETFVQKVGRSRSLRLTVFAIVFAGIGATLIYSTFAASAKASLNLSANPLITTNKLGHKITLKWSATNIKHASCTATASYNLWDGPISDNGSKIITFPLKKYGTYKLSFKCTNVIGDSVYSDTLTVYYN